MNCVDEQHSGFDENSQCAMEIEEVHRLEPDCRALRRRVLKGVQISFNNEYCTVEGVMKNISETGAFIKLKDGYLLPDHIVIHNNLEGYKISAQIVRRQVDQVGVRFTGYAEKTEQVRAQVINMLDTGACNTDGMQQSDNNHLSVAESTRKKPSFGKLGTVR